MLKVLVVEKASTQQRHAQQVEVFGRNDGTINHGSLIVHRLDGFADQWQPRGTAVAQGKSGLVADSRFFHAGQGAGAAKNLVQQDRFLRGGLIRIGSGIVGPGQPGLNGDNAFRIEAGGHLIQVPKTSQQKTRGDHKHQRERQFTDDQNLAGARAFPGTFVAAPFLLQRTDQVDSAHKPGGSKPEDRSGRDAERHSKHQHAPTNRDIVNVRQAFRNKPQQVTLSAEKNGKASDSAKQEEQQNLGKKLADEARSLRSQSLANRDLTTSSAGSGEQQIGDVDATDQENQSYRAEQQNERLANASHDGFTERNQTHGPCGLCRILPWIFLFQRFTQRIEVPLRGSNRDTVLQAREDRSTPQTEIALRRIKRHPGKAGPQPQCHILLRAG